MLTKNKERRKQEKKKEKKSSIIIFFLPVKSKLEITHGPLEDII